MRYLLLLTVFLTTTLYAQVVDSTFYIDELTNELVIKYYPSKLDSMWLLLDPRATLPVGYVKFSEGTYVLQVYEDPPDTLRIARDWMGFEGIRERYPWVSALQYVIREKSSQD